MSILSESAVASRWLALPPREPGPTDLRTGFAELAVTCLGAGGGEVPVGT